MVQPIDLHIFIQKLTDRDKLFLRAFGLYGRLLWRAKFADGLLVFDLSDPQICGFVGRKTFIYWFGISGAAVQISYCCPFLRGLISSHSLYRVLRAA